MSFASNYANDRCPVLHHLITIRTLTCRCTTEISVRRHRTGRIRIFTNSRNHRSVVWRPVPAVTPRRTIWCLRVRWWWTGRRRRPGIAHGWDATRDESDAVGWNRNLTPERAKHRKNQLNKIEDLKSKISGRGRGGRSKAGAGGTPGPPGSMNGGPLPTGSDGSASATDDDDDEQSTRCWSAASHDGNRTSATAHVTGRNARTTRWNDVGDERSTATARLHERTDATWLPWTVRCNRLRTILTDLCLRLILKRKRCENGTRCKWNISKANSTCVGNRLRIRARRPRPWHRRSRPHPPANWCHREWNRPIHHDCIKWVNLKNSFQIRYLQQTRNYRVISVTFKWQDHPHKWIIMNSVGGCFFLSLVRMDASTGFLHCLGIEGEELMITRHVNRAYRPGNPPIPSSSSSCKRRTIDTVESFHVNAEQQWQSVILGSRSSTVVPATTIRFDYTYSRTTLHIWHHKV